LTEMTEDDQTYQHTAGHETKEIDDGYVVYHVDRERVHFLNPTAVIVYELCDGSHSVGSICDFIKSAYDLAEAPVEEVRKCIASMIEEKLIRPSTLSSSAA